VLRLSQFQLQRETGVWRPPIAGPAGEEFDYSDGDIEEQRVLRAVRTAADIADNASALLSFVEDWPTYYHLAPGRSNAIRSLGLPRDISVLELGAGCGALARHLGENHARVDSVEGSLRRAEICRARCRDLANVSVFHADFSDLTFDAEYDVVLLNGVLEYAPSFFRGQTESEPVEALLRRAQSALRTGGVAIIAIENKLGLKYWSGAPEDHTATAYEGLHGYPSTDKRVTTFSRRELKRLIVAAGFASATFYYCFPDYKFASTVFSEALPRGMFLHNWIDFPAECPGLVRQYSIHEGLAAKSVYEAGLLAEFANSFVVVAGLEGSDARFADVFRPSWVVKRLSVRGRDRLNHRITTLARADEGYVVAKAAVNYARSATAPAAVAAPWIPGELVLIEMSRAMLASNRDEAVHALLAEYRRELLDRFAINDRDSEGYPLLHGRCMEFLMRNLIRGPAALVPIDLEWEEPKPIPVDFMLFRSLWNDAIAPNHAWASRSIPDFDLYIVRAIQRLYPAYGFARHSLHKTGEDRFLARVRGDSITPHREAAVLMAGKAWGRSVTSRLRNRLGFS
jgi:SAM-dependent methyltransferase